jgi:hypothetical protein
MCPTLSMALMQNCALRRAVTSLELGVDDGCRSMGSAHAAELAHATPGEAWLYLGTSAALFRQHEGFDVLRMALDASLVGPSQKDDVIAHATGPRPAHCHASRFL